MRINLLPDVADVLHHKGMFDYEQAVRYADSRIEELEAIVRRVATGLREHHDPLSSEGQLIDHYDLSNTIAKEVLDAAFDRAIEAAKWPAADHFADQSKKVEAAKGGA